MNKLFTFLAALLCATTTTWAQDSGYPELVRNQTQLEPVLYVSDEAHYSNMRLAHLQNLDMRLVASDSMGRMIPDSLEKVLMTSRPALMV